jgi:hypothetical protein
MYNTGSYRLHSLAVMTVYLVESLYKTRYVRTLEDVNISSNF